VAVLGSGSWACALAAMYALRGYEVNIYDLPEFEKGLTPIRERGGIEVYGGEVSGFAQLNKVTTDPEEAVEGVDLIILSARLQGHVPLLLNCVPYLEKGQTVAIFTPMFSVFQLLHRLEEKGERIPEGVILSEVGYTSLLMHANV